MEKKKAMKMFHWTADGERTEMELPGGGQVQARRNRKDGQDVVMFELAYNGAYGMGEKYNGLNQKGKTAVNLVVEKFCRQGENTYLAAPFFVTDTGFGVYIKTAEKTVFHFGEQITCELPRGAPVILSAGPVQEVIAAFMKLSGPPALPPKFSFGVWISANHWNSLKAVEEQLALLEKYEFPASVMVLEAWSDEATFYIWNGASYEPKAGGKTLASEDFDFSKSTYWDDPAGMIRRLHEKGIQLVLWQIPVYKKQDAGEPECVQLNLDREDAISRGLCVHRTDGTPYEIPVGNWFAGSMIPDFTNADTKKTWFAKRKYLLEMGVDGFKTDGGEFIYREDVRFADGTAGTEGKNRYAQEYTSAYTEFIGRERVLFSRAGFTGAHTTPIHWAGDQQSENEELKSVLAAGLSAAMTGIPFWGFDIAGFAGPLPTTDLYRRATQLACFTPVMQWHSEPDGGQFKLIAPGAEGNNERSPWNVALSRNCAGLIEEMRFWHRLRMNLIPYLYSTAMDCCEKYMPMMRPLVYEWPEDENAVRTEDEFLLGDSLLIAPLLKEKECTRDVYFPAGEWYGLFTRKKYAGKNIRTSDDGERMPVYLRSGTALALKGCAREGLGCGKGNETGRIEDLHFLLAGEKGGVCFRDESRCIKVCWEKKAVRIEKPEAWKVTWEIIEG